MGNDFVASVVLARCPVEAEDSDIGSDFDNRVAGPGSQGQPILRFTSNDEIVQLGAPNMFWSAHHPDDKKNIMRLRSTAFCSAMLLFATSVVADEQTQPATVARVQEQQAADEPRSTEPVDIPVLIQELTSAEFQVRQKGVDALRNVPPEQLQKVGEAIEANGSTDAIRRWIDVLEQRYQNLTPGSESLFYVSETLQRFGKSDTWFVSEAANRVLERNWKRQIELAVLQLNRLKFPLDPKDPAKLFQYDPDVFTRPTSDRYLKLVIDHSFPNNPEVFEHLERLAPLRSKVFLRSPQLVSVIMIDGHPLTEEQEVRIKAIFGDIAVQERGPACLGISPDVRDVGSGGVLVGSVAAAKSAALAGIADGDFILDMDGEPLSDFEQMVKRLRKYRIGDKVKLKVIRAARLGSSKSEDVEVTLTGWYEGATNAPAR